METQRRHGGYGGGPASACRSPAQSLGLVLSAQEASSPPLPLETPMRRTRSLELEAEPRRHFPSPSFGFPFRKWPWGLLETCDLPQGPQRRRVGWKGSLWPECPLMGEQTCTCPTRVAPASLTGL